MPAAAIEAVAVAVAAAVLEGSALGVRLELLVSTAAAD
jgi:hypothetical protein